jgi:hypothetical protein
LAAPSADQQDALSTQLESGQLALGAVDSKSFSNLVLQNVREGFCGDPIYGDNKDMAGWKMVGFPGAQYDFRDVIRRRGEDLKSFRSVAYATMRRLLHDDRSAGDNAFEKRNPCSSSQPMFRSMSA